MGEFRRPARGRGQYAISVTSSLWDEDPSLKARAARKAASASRATANQNECTPTSQSRRHPIRNDGSGLFGAPPKLGPGDSEQERLLFASICSRIKAAAYTDGGTNWEKLFREQDKDRSGQICWSEFYSMCRRVLKVTESEDHLNRVFKSLDIDGSGDVELEEFIQFVNDPVERMRNRIRQALEGVGAKQLFLKHDADCTGQLGWDEFLRMCRGDLKLLDSEAHLRMAFRAVDNDDSGQVSLSELVGFLYLPRDKPAIATEVKVATAADNKGKETSSPAKENEESSGPSLLTMMKAVTRLKGKQIESTQVDSKTKIQQMNDTTDLLRRICSRVKAAAYTNGGRDWEKLFREQDKDGSGDISWAEFYSMCRRVLKLKDTSKQLRIVFRMLDTEGNDIIPISTIIEFVADPAKRMRSRLSEAAQATGTDLTQCFVEGSGCIEWPAFRAVCRNHLKLSDNDTLLNIVFRTMDADGSGVLSCSELVDFLSPETSEKALVAMANGVANSHARVAKKKLVAMTHLLKKVCSRVKAAAYTYGGKDWTKLFREQDKDRSGEISWPEFYSMCRRVLRLTEDEQQLRVVFKCVDFDGDGEVSIDELVIMVKDPVSRMRLRLRDAVETAGGDDWQSFFSIIGFGWFRVPRFHGVQANVPTPEAPRH
jgi:Ca2+-binding EF-hand superfamily protein